MPEQCLDANNSDASSFSFSSHGWEEIQDCIYNTVNGLDLGYLAFVGGLGAPEWIQVTGRDSQRRLLMTVAFEQLEGYDMYSVLAIIQ